jgi:hypothetical protein
MIQEATIAFQKDSNLFVDAVQPSTLCGAVLKTLMHLLSLCSSYAGSPYVDITKCCARSPECGTRQ